MAKKTKNDKKDLLIKLLVDRSGSIHGCLSDMQGAYDTYISDMRKDSSISVMISLDQFDTKYDRVYDFTDVNKVPSYTIVPRGMTALYDAISRATSHLDEQDNNKKKLVVIITDGLENSSREVTSASLKTMIENKINAGWDFIYLGANQDAILEASKIGIPQRTSMSYDVNSAPVAMTAVAGASFLSASPANYVGFTGQQRSEAMGGKKSGKTWAGNS